MTAHKINTGDAKPIKLPQGRLPKSQRDIAEREIESMSQKELIKPRISVDSLAGAKYFISCSI